MQTKVYKIRAITNLHPGSGDADYGVVDKLVQRDPVTGFPTIHMSAIKGAMREYFKKSESIKLGNDQITKDNAIRNVFGSDPNADSDQVQQGRVRFISAELLAMPKISERTSGKAYDLCYVLELIEDWKEKVQLFGGTVDAVVKESWKKQEMKDFKALSEKLPVVARNHLDNGESQNLWYEEFVPRESVFGMIVQGPKDEIDVFDDVINGKVIQIGGNATVGYGYCLFTQISTTS